MSLVSPIPPLPSPPRVRILAQPDDTTCGPTCLHAIYDYFGDEVPLDQLIREVVSLPSQGTLAVLLACHALRRGYRATIFTYNLVVFDPSWFHLAPEELPDRLREQRSVKSNDPRLQIATEAYLEFLALGGVVRFQELTPALIRDFLLRDRPILTGLSATYLYGCPREVDEPKIEYDDLRGLPAGHFVILSGYDVDRDEILVADPLRENPRFQPHYYRVGVQRVLGAILLGVLTFDANLLILEPIGAAEPAMPLDP